MKPVCPKCCPFPKTGRFPELGEEVDGYRKCPVCERVYNNNLEIVEDYVKPTK